METVAAYLRNSSGQQEQSISRQKAEVIEYCKPRGYKVVQWYIDEDISGHKTTRRQWLKMLDDCSKQLFSKIVIWDTFRFYRLNNVKSGKFKEKLMDNNVKLESMKDGILDFNDSNDRLKSAFLDEQGEAYLKTLSVNTVSGRNKFVSQGWWMVGEIPYGYDRIYVFEGKETFVPRGQKYPKGRNEHLKLTINEDEKQIVQHIFETISKPKNSLIGLSKNLAKDGIYMSPQILRRIILNPVYTGHTVLGKGKKKGKFSTCETQIIPYKDYKIVDEKLATLARSNLKEVKTTDIRRGALSGFLVCHHCGYRMAKRTIRGENKYFCESSLKRAGKTPCTHQTCCKENEELFHLLDNLRMLVPDLEAKLKRKQKTDDSAKVVARLKREAEELEKQIARAKRNILILDDVKLVKELQMTIRATEQERNNVLRQIADVSVSKSKNEQALQQIQTYLVSNPRFYGNVGPGKALKMPDVEPLRELLDSLNMTVSIEWGEDVEARQKDRRAFAYPVVYRRLCVNGETLMNYPVPRVELKHNVVKATGFEMGSKEANTLKNIHKIKSRN